jgi:hypothetical protein
MQSLFTDFFFVENMVFSSCYLPFILLLSIVVSAVDLRETSAKDIGVSGGEDTSLLSLLCLDSNNLFAVRIGVLWLFEGIE